MSTVELFYDGNDIWDDVVVTGARFTSQVNGVAGTCVFRVKDPDQSRSFVVGKSLRLRIDGRYHWTGYVSKKTLVYGFDALSTSAGTTRFFQIEGSDINVLFEKRVTYRQANPANLVGDVYPAGTNDNVVIGDLVSDWLDLSGDGLDTSTLVEFVGDVEDSVEFTPWHGSWKWGEAMGTIARLPVAIFYIDPDKKLVYTDVDTPNVDWVLTDEPEATTSGIGYREMRFTNDGGNLINDFLAWGTGGGSPTPVFVRDDDATSIATHGRWQAATIEHGVYKQGTINRIASSYVNGSPQSKRGHKDDRRRIELTVFDPYFRPSDKARFISSVYGIDEPFPVRSSTIEFLGPTTPRFRLLLSFDIDQPWGYFDPPRFRPIPWGIDPPPDFDPPGLPGGGGDCPADCFLTDTFTRTVADGWGTSDVGTVWTHTTGTGASEIEVTGTEGHLFNPAISNGNSGNGLSNEVVFQNNDITQDFDLTFDVRWDSAHTGGSLEFQETFFGMRAATGISRMSFFHGNAAPNSIDLSTVGVGGSASVSYTVALGTQFTVRWQQVTGSYQRMKIWASSGAEPGSWTLTQTTTGQTAWSGGSTRMVIQTSQPQISVSENVSALDVYIDNLDIDGISNCESVQLDGYDRTVGQAATPDLGASTSGDTYAYFGGNSQGTIGIANGYMRMTTTSGGGSFKNLGFGDGFTLPAGDGIWRGFRMKFRTSYVSAAQGDHTFEISGGADNGLEVDLDFSVSNGRINIHGPGSVAPEPGFLDVTWSLNSWYILDMVMDENMDFRAKFYREIDGPPADYNMSADGFGDPTGSGGQLDFIWAFWNNVAGHTFDIDYVEVDYNGKPCYGCATVLWEDTFTRSVSDGWGTAAPGGSAAGTWNTPSHPTSFDVDGDDGVIIAGSGGGTEIRTIRLPFLASLTRIDLVVRFRMNRSMNGTDAIQLFSGQTAPDLRITDTDIDLTGVGGTDSISNSLSMTSSVSVRFYGSVGGTMSVTVWNNTLGGEPSPQLTIPCDPGDSFDVFDIRVEASTASTTFLFSEMFFEGEPCAEIIPGGEQAPLSGPYCETIVPTSGIYLITAAPFLSGSEVVRVNGITQLPGQDYSANGVEGLITMNFTLDSTDTAHVCYQVNR